MRMPPPRPSPAGVRPVHGVGIIRPGSGNGGIASQTVLRRAFAGSLQKQTGDLRGQVEGLTKENEGLKRQVADLRARLKPGTKPAARPAPKRP